MPALAYTAAMSAPKREHQDAIATVRNSFADVTGRARYSDEPTVLTARSKPVAAVVSMDFYDWARTVAGLLHEAAADPARAEALRAAGVDLSVKLPDREKPRERTLRDQAADYRSEA
jgi:prevent-host-death family protein